jgi:hypothetical protein
MPSCYLQPQDYPFFGCPNATQDQVTKASLLVDSYLARPEGLVWMPDSAGQPCYMANLRATYTCAATTAITAGTMVNVPVPPQVYNTLSTFGAVGTVVVLDRTTTTGGQTGLVEACVINAIQPGFIQLTSVMNNHITGCTLEFGMVIQEQKSLPSKRSVTRVNKNPIARVISGVGSYRYGRRNDQQSGLYADQSILALIQTFGGPPEWIPFNPTASDWNSQTCEIWIPSGIFLAYYSDIRIWYVAGYQYMDLPYIVKQVTANIINSNINTSDLAGGIKKAQAGDTMIERFANTVLSGDDKAMLDQYKVSVFI